MHLLKLFKILQILQKLYKLNVSIVLIIWLAKHGCGTVPNVDGPTDKMRRRDHNFRNPCLPWSMFLCLSQVSLWTKKNFSAQERKTNYEEHRPERKFDNDWQAKIPRLKIDDIKNSSNKFGFAGNIWACLSANITLHN
jgi:hypothetical protein